MPLQIDGILFDELSVDPGSPSEGQVWYNTTLKLFKAYRNGAVTSFVDYSEFTAHTGDTSNPHDTTLEQARSQSNVLAGVIDMGGFAINNLGAGSLPTDAAQRQWVTDQVNQKVAGLDWQESVLARSATPPGSPVSGDRYLIIATASGAWAGQENKVTQYDGSAWQFYTPNEGWTLRVEAENLIYTFDGTSWGNIGGAVSHTALVNLNSDDHLQYLNLSGVRAMTGDLNMGGQSITNVNLVDGVDVSAHGSRHNPDGADPVTVAAPTGLSAGGANVTGTANSLSRSDHQHAIALASAVELTDSTNSSGSATTFVASDHQHAHGNRGGGSLHALASSTQAGFMPQYNRTATLNPTVNDDGTLGYVAGSLWINTTNNTTWVAISVATGAAVWKELTNISSTLPAKAGKVLAASFAGTPKKATVTFTTPFADTNYAVALTPIVSAGGAQYVSNVESQTAGSFVITMGTSTISSLVAVSWTATYSGESV